MTRAARAARCGSDLMRMKFSGCGAEPPFLMEIPTELVQGTDYESVQIPAQSFRALCNHASIGRTIDALNTAIDGARVDGDTENLNYALDELLELKAALTHIHQAIRSRRNEIGKRIDSNA